MKLLNILFECENKKGDKVIVPLEKKQIEIHLSDILFTRDKRGQQVVTFCKTDESDGISIQDIWFSSFFELTGEGYKYKVKKIDFTNKTCIIEEIGDSDEKETATRK